MSMSEQTIKCPICGNPYKVYSHYAADQSACRTCINKAEGNANTGDFRDLPRESQQEYFGRT